MVGIVVCFGIFVAIAIVMDGLFKLMKLVWKGAKLLFREMTILRGYDDVPWGDD